MSLSKQASLTHPTSASPDRQTRTFSAPPNLSSPITSTTLDLLPAANPETRTASAPLPSPTRTTTTRKKKKNRKARKTKTNTNRIPASVSISVPSRSSWWIRCGPPAAKTRLPLDLDTWLPPREFDAKMRRRPGVRGYTRAMLAKTAVGRKIAAAQDGADTGGTGARTGGGGKGK